LSRGQQGNVISTASGVQKTDSNLANTSFTNAQSDIGTMQTDVNKTQADVNGYGAQLDQFKANNPYVQGGQAETVENQQLADTAAGQAESGGETLQSQAARTGQNAGGAIAATEHMKEDNARTLMGQEADATAGRIAAGTGYGEALLGGEATKTGLQGGVEGEQAGVEGAQEQLGATEGGLAQGALNTEEGAAQTPSFMDELGQGVIKAGVNFAGKFGPPGGGGK
jgi:hypothetical protein